MSKTDQFTIDYNLARKAVKWMNKGSKMTNPTKKRLYTYEGRVRKNREAVATNYEGAMYVGFAKTTNLREMRLKRDRNIGFWNTILHFERAYEDKYGSTPEQDNLVHGREYVRQRANRIK